MWCVVGLLASFLLIRSGAIFNKHLSDASPYIANTFLVSSDAAAATKNNGEEDAALDEERNFVNYEATEILPPPFDSAIPIHEDKSQDSYT